MSLGYTNQVTAPKYSLVSLDNNAGGLSFQLSLALMQRLRESLFVDFWRHKKSASPSACHQEKPDSPPPICAGQRSNSKETNGGSDGTTPIDETSNSSKGLVVSTHRWVRGKIRSDS
mmetsp:Transcript_5212/g.10902  ORF Transcript_5212/g.10902 Transcript_5212/m.10902 type:complete len:117 (-) Transcript_5212:768-1118(-)